MANNNDYEATRQRNLEIKNRQEIIYRNVERINGLLPLLPDDQRSILKSGNPEQIIPLLKEHNILDTEGILRAIPDWQQHKDVAPQKEEPLPITSDESSAIPGVGVAQATAAGVLGGVGIYGYVKNRKYNKFKNSARKYAEQKAKEWEKNPDQTHAKNKKETYDIAHQEAHDQFIRDNPLAAEKWAKQHKDKEFKYAIEKKRVEEEMAKEPKPPSGQETATERTKRTQKETMANYRATGERPPAMIGATGPSTTMPSELIRIPPPPPPPPQNSSANQAHAGSPRQHATSSPARTLPQPHQRRRRPGIGIPGVGGKKKALARIALANLPIIATIVIIVVLIILVFAVLVSSCKTPFLDFVAARLGFCPNFSIVVNLPESPEGIEVSKTGSYKDDNKEIKYNLTITVDPDKATIDQNGLSLFDVPDYDFNLVSATGKYELKDDPSNNQYVEWKLSENQDRYTENNAGHRVYTFELVTRAKEDDFDAYNTAYVAREYKKTELVIEEPISGTESLPEKDTGNSGDTTNLTEGRSEPPSNNTCNGSWNIAMFGQDEKKDGVGGVDGYFKGKRSNINFGDPICTYSKAKWNKHLEDTEEDNGLLEFWKDIAATEGSVNSGDASGWGKFQMNTGSPVFRQPQVGSIRGDVTWQRQIEIAVARNNYLRKSNIDNKGPWNFGFWGTAYCLCYFDYYREKNAWCGDLVRRKDVRCPNYCKKNSCSTRTDALGIAKSGKQGCNDYQCN